VKRNPSSFDRSTRRILREVTRRILPSGIKNPKSKIQSPKWAAPYPFAIVSGILLTLSFPGWNLDFLAWFALMPLVHGILRYPESAFRQGFIAGVVFFWCTLYWLWHVTVPGWLALGTYLALFPAVWAWSLSRFRAVFAQNSGAHHLRLAAFGGASWVALEWLRGTLITGFPWNVLGVSQFRNLPIIQISEITGVLGISFLIVFVNVALFCGVRRMVLEKFSMGRWRYEITAALFLLVIVVIWGMRSFTAQTRFPPAQTIQVALIQPNVPQTLKWNEAADRKARQDLKQLTLDAAALAPDLIIWPETALTSGPGFDGKAADLVEEMMIKGKTPLLIGTLDQDPFQPRLYYNAALFMTPDAGYAPPYHKRHLVPFGEFVPLDKTFPALKKLTPVGENLGSGSGPQLIQDHGVWIGMLICFEDIFSYLARDSVRSGANILVNITNDGWFKESHEQRQHAANAVFRAVENRVPLVRCCNNGYSCIIEPTGRISAVLADAEGNIYIKGMKITDVNLYDRPPAFYTRYGDLFAMLCLILTGGVWAMWGWQALRKRKSP
jgi:apolipoprotein N-acyltransferase